MKTGNGHQTADVPLEGLSSQVATAVGELLRAQQDLEARGKAVEDREREIAQAREELEARSAAIAARAAEIERTTEELRERASALEERERQVAERDAKTRDLDSREEEQRNREAALFVRERTIAAREADLVDVSAESSRLAEREQAIASERAACEESATTLARHEAEIEARAAQLVRRERVFESVCEMLRSMTTALNEPTPENISAALAATSKANEIRPALAAANEVVRRWAEQPPQAASSFKTGTTAPEDDAAPDLSDFTDEEHRRLRMLQQLGTASLADIVATIRAERATLGFEPSKKKRRLGFLK